MTLAAIWLTSSDRSQGFYSPRRELTKTLNEKNDYYINQVLYACNRYTNLHALSSQYMNILTVGSQDYNITFFFKYYIPVTSILSNQKPEDVIHFIYAPFVTNHLNIAD